MGMQQNVENQRKVVLNIGPVKKNNTTVLNKVKDLIRQKYFALARELIARSLKRRSQLDCSTGEAC